MTSRLRRLGPRSVLAVLLASLVLVPAMLASPASADTPKKLYGADVSPHFVLAGSTETYTFTLTNEAKNQLMGSANLKAPSGFSINSIGFLSQGTASLFGNTIIRLRNLNLQPGQTATLSFSATAPSSPGSYQWTLDVRLANDFRGAGNSFSPDPVNVHLTTTVPGEVVACTANQPCTGSATDGTTTADVNVDPGSAGVLTVTLFPTDAITCPEGEGSYVGTSATVDFNVSADDRTKTVTITIDDSLVGDRGPEDFQVCYSSNATFMDRFGNTIDPPDAGLLPDCSFPIEIESVSSVPDNPPCVISRSVDPDTGDVSVTFFAPAGDPKGHI